MCLQKALPKHSRNPKNWIDLQLVSLFRLARLAPYWLSNIFNITSPSKRWPSSFKWRTRPSPLPCNWWLYVAVSFLLYPENIPSPQCSPSCIRISTELWFCGYKIGQQRKGCQFHPELCPGRLGEDGDSGQYWPVAIIQKGQTWPFRLWPFIWSLSWPR